MMADTTDAVRPLVEEKCARTLLSTCDNLKI